MVGPAQAEPGRARPGPFVTNIDHMIIFFCSLSRIEKINRFCDSVLSQSPICLWRGPLDCELVPLRSALLAMNFYT